MKVNQDVISKTSVLHGLFLSRVIIKKSNGEAVMDFSRLLCQIPRLDWNNMGGLSELVRQQFRDSFIGMDPPDVDVRVSDKSIEIRTMGVTSILGYVRIALRMAELDGNWVPCPVSMELKGLLAAPELWGASIGIYSEAGISLNSEAAKHKEYTIEKLTCGRSVEIKIDKVRGK